LSRAFFKFLLILTLPLLALGFWRHELNLKRAAERDLFFSYVDGPLNDYAFAVTRALPYFFGSKAAEVPEALKSARASAEGLRKLVEASSEGWIHAQLLELLPLHEKMASMIAELPLPKPKQAAWLADENDLRRRLIYILELVRYEKFSQWKMTQERFLEMNALIYSLKEAQESAGKE
jgi:hypothetical protein